MEQLCRITFKFTMRLFDIEIIGGELFLDTNNQDNEDIIEVAWIPLNDFEKFDPVTMPVLELARK
jgi:8-oxo-dGTP diphosphatase